MDKPIPPIPTNEGWRNHPIRSNGERLISIQKVSDKLSVYPFYAKQGIPCAMDEIWLREEAAKRLYLAAQRLPDGISMFVLDGWRSFDVQSQLFEMWKSHYKGAYPHLTEEGLILHTEKYVSLPSRNLLAPAPHATGGSIDVSLMREGKLMMMGTDFDDMSPKASIRYFEELLEQSIPLSTKQQEALCNRRLLYRVMTEVGFTAYAEEWWHFDFGNQWWGMQKKEPARYNGLWDSITKRVVYNQLVFRNDCDIITIRKG